MLATAHRTWRGARRATRSAGLAFVMLLLAAGTGGAAEPVGQAAPDFALRGASGDNFRLSEYRGDVVLLNFWADWCNRCREQLPRLADIARDYAGRDLSVLTVNIDGDASHAIEAAHRLGLTVLHDADQQVARAYATDTLPMTLLIDQHGVVRQVYTSYRSHDERDYRSVADRLLGATAASDRGNR